MGDVSSEPAESFEEREREKERERGMIPSASEAGERSVVVRSVVVRRIRLSVSRHTLAAGRRKAGKEGERNVVIDVHRRVSVGIAVQIPLRGGRTRRGSSGGSGSGGSPARSLRSSTSNIVELLGRRGVESKAPVVDRIAMTLAPRNRRLVIGVEQCLMFGVLLQLLQLHLREAEIPPLHSVPQLFVGERVHIVEEENTKQLAARSLGVERDETSGGGGRHHCSNNKAQHSTRIDSEFDKFDFIRFDALIQSNCAVLAIECDLRSSFAVEQRCTADVNTKQAIIAFVSVRSLMS
jgi:hypothetical protein